MHYVSELVSDICLNKSFMYRLYHKHDSFYRECRQPKMKFGAHQINKDGNPKMRDLLIPMGDLKEMQTLIAQWLQCVELPDCMFGSVKYKNNILNALEHIENTFFLTIDLKNYFSNISVKQVRQTLQSHKLSWKDTRLITKIVTYKGSLPQGAPSSPMVANLVFAKTAYQLQLFCNEKGIKFTNFMDDLAFSSKKHFQHFIPEILNIVKGNGFIINNNKIHYLKGVCEITGLYVGHNNLALEKEMKKHLDVPGIRAYALRVKKLSKEHQLNKKTEKAKLLSTTPISYDFV